MNATNAELDFSRPATSFERRRAAFDAFHHRNPHVYAELVRRARAVKANGARRLGMRMLVEVLRWDMMFKTVRLEGEPKINDWFCPFYVDLIEQQEADLRSLFERRRGDS